MRCLGGSREEGEDSVDEVGEEGSVVEAAAVEEGSVVEAAAAVEEEVAVVHLEDTMVLLLAARDKGLDLMAPHQAVTGQATDKLLHMYKRGLYLTKVFGNSASLFTNIQRHMSMSYSSPPRSLKTR